MTRWLLIVLSLLAAAHAAPIHAADATPFLAHPRWDGGTAEVSLYEAREVRYGTPRNATVTHYLVKEPWNNARNVKSDTPSGRDVLKLNQVASVPTGIYRYEQMHSLFVDRTSGTLVKFSYSHHDACGNTFKMGLAKDGTLALTWHTYWDGEGDGTSSLKWPDGAHLYEELPLLVRRWAAEKPSLPRTLRLLNPQMTSRIGTPGTALARASVQSTGGLFRFTIEHPGGKDELEVDEPFPHLLRSWKRPDGSSLRLRSSEMTAYWQRNRPEDERGR